MLAMALAGSDRSRSSRGVDQAPDGLALAVDHGLGLRLLGFLGGSFLLLAYRAILGLLRIVAGLHGLGVLPGNG
jgi:hypothetical protein